MNIMGYEILEDNLETLDLSKKQIINTINPHSYVTGKVDSLFYKALQSSDVLIPDGSGIVLAAKQINKQIIKKISGAVLHEFLLEKMNKKRKLAKFLIHLAVFLQNEDLFILKYYFCDTYSSSAF